MLPVSCGLGCGAQTHITDLLEHCNHLIPHLIFFRQHRQCFLWLLCSCSPGCLTTSSQCGQSLGTFPSTTSPSPSASSPIAWPMGTPASTPSFTLSSQRTSARPVSRPSTASASCSQSPLRSWSEYAWRTSLPHTQPLMCKWGSEIPFRRREKGSV